jgi:WS/DGAT/MGAT family acyltransferase
MPLTQLSPLDVAFLCLEGKDSPMHMGAVATFSPRRPVDPMRMAGLLVERAERIPRLRERVRTIRFPPGAAVWEPAPEFSAGDHVHIHRVSGLYDPDPLATYAARWIARPLDLSRPLWNAHVVTGLPGGDFAVLLKMHHAMTDGAGAFAIAAGLLDESPGATGTAGTQPAPPSALGALREGITTAVGQAGENAGIALSLARATRPFPISPLTAPRSAKRRVGLVRLDAADVRQIRRTHGGTANDVILAVLAGALREWLVNHGHRADGGPLRALVPVSLRGRQRRAGANQLSGYLCELPIHADDPVQRLHLVRASMHAGKSGGPAHGAGAFPVLADRLPSALHRIATRFTGPAAGLLFDLVVTNVPLPGLELTMGGAPLSELYPLVPLASRQALGIAVSTYRSGVHIGLQANGEAVVDLGSLRDAVLKSAASLRLAS